MVPSEPLYGNIIQRQLRPAIRLGRAMPGGGLLRKPLVSKRLSAATRGQTGRAMALQV